MPPSFNQAQANEIVCEKSAWEFSFSISLLLVYTCSSRPFQKGKLLNIHYDEILAVEFPQCHNEYLYYATYAILIMCRSLRHKNESENICVNILLPVFSFIFRQTSSQLSTTKSSYRVENDYKCDCSDQHIYILYILYIFVGLKKV